MKKFSLIALASFVALTGAAQAQTGFDLNALPLTNIPANVDKTPTGSIGAKMMKRLITRDGSSVTQYYTVDANGKVTVVSEKAN